MKNKIIISSILTIAMCFSLIAGSTFALFTSESNVNIAVTSGKIDVVATIDETTLATSSLGVAQTAGAFANGGSATLSGDTLTLDKLTPGDKATFSITVTNNSNVAMQYRFAWTIDGELVDYLTATVDGVAIENGVTPYTTWTGANKQTFNVVVALPESVGNGAQNKSASISFKVDAIQGNVEIVDGAQYKVAEDGSKYLYVVDNSAPETLNVIDGIASIGRWSFNGNTSVKKVVLPTSVTSIEYKAFDSSAVEEIVLNEGLAEVSSKAFSKATKLNTITFPSTLTTVGSESFRLTGFETLTIPATLTHIGEGAFRDVTNLTTLTIEGNATLDNFAFRTCRNLTDVYLLGDDYTFNGSMIFSRNDAGSDVNGVINVYVLNESVKDELLAATSYDPALNVVVLPTPIANGLYVIDGTYYVSSAEGFMALHGMMANHTAGRDISVNIMSDLDMTGHVWTPIDSHIDWGFNVKEINGNGHTISNLTINGQAMFRRFAGGSDVVIKNLTFDNATVNHNSINTAIIVGQTYNNILLDNVDVKNSSITGGYKVATLIATVYDEKSSTITATLKNCDVENVTIKSLSYDFYTAGLVSFVYADSNDKIEFENCSVNNLYLSAVANGYNYHAPIYWDDTATLYKEVDGVTVGNWTFENIQ